MSDISSILEVLQNRDSESTLMIQPAIKEAVAQGILPKHAPMEIYEKHWEGMREVLIKFLEGVE